MNNDVASTTRESAEVLAKIIYKAIKNYAKTQKDGVSFDQINDALTLVAEDLTLQTVRFL